LILKTLRDHSEGIICLSGCISGIIAKKIARNEEDQAAEWTKKFLDLFGDGFSWKFSPTHLHRT
jgi:DNA polymerase III subunit alpha